MEGWIKLHRGLVDNQLWHCEPFTRGQAWVDLLLLANFNHSYFFKRGVKIEVERGQVARSEVELADRWKWSRTKVRKFLNVLEKEQQIEQHKSNVTQLITIVNYNYYQEKEQQLGQQKDSRKTAEKQQKNTLEEEQEEQEEKEKRDSFVETGFDQPNSLDSEISILRSENTSWDTIPIKQGKKPVTGGEQGKAVDYEASQNRYKKMLITEINASDFPELKPDYIEIAKAFKLLFEQNLIEAGATTVNIDKAKGTWVDDIRLIIENDKYTLEDLRAAYTFLQKNAFWKKNILSTSKLREKMDKIKLELKNGNNRNSSKEPATSFEQITGILINAFPG